MAGTWKGPRRLGWAGLVFSLLATVGCVSVQIGGNTEPTVITSRPTETVTSAVHPSSYTPPPGRSPAAVQPVDFAAPPVAPMGTDPMGMPTDPMGMVPMPGVMPPPPAGPTRPGPVPAVPLMAGPGPLNHVPVHGPAPTELAMRSLPPYRVEPPDILLLEAVRLIPRPPYVVGPLDRLLLRVAEPLPNQPIEGIYTVGNDGTINLGYSYGVVSVAGLTMAEAEAAIRKQLSRVLKEPQVAVGLAEFRALQQVRGLHLVRMDGTINLGTYGCVYVAGLTLQQIKVAIERHLSQYVLDPEINVDVSAYNSKVYYVIADGAGFGQTIFRLPITGKETVLDAIANVQGLSQVASKKKIWVARPAPADNECLQILPVDWRAITEGGATTTNYQLFPGDRVYVGPDPLILTDNFLAKLLAPVERVLGVTLLGTATVNQFRTGGGNTGAAFIAPIR